MRFGEIEVGRVSSRKISRRRSNRERIEKLAGKMGLRFESPRMRGAHDAIEENCGRPTFRAESSKRVLAQHGKNGTAVRIQSENGREECEESALVGSNESPTSTQTPFPNDAYLSLNLMLRRWST